MKRRNLLKSVGAASMLAFGATTAAGDSHCHYYCCQECEQIDWTCDGAPCSCIEYCPYAK